MKRVLEEADDRGELPPGTPPRALARTIIAIGYGMLVLGKTAPAKAGIADIADTALALLET